MTARRRDIYRRRRRARFPIALILGILLAIIALAVILFFSLQKYAVYDRDGVTLAIPGLTDVQTGAQTDEDDDGDLSRPDTPTPVHPVDAEIVVEAADYSKVDLQPGEDLAAVRGRYIGANHFSALGTLTAATDASAALVLEMKTPEGVLSWNSASELAQGYGVNGHADLAEMIPALKDKGYYLVAELNCCRDTLLAKRSPSLSLKNTAGEPFQDERGGWLDPYGVEMRNYLLFLMEELYAAGFDEILLSGLSFPLNDGVVSYAQDRIGASTPRAAVSGLAVWLARSAPEDMTVSVMLEKNALHGTGKPDKESPQDAELFTRIFDRLYIQTDALSLASDSAALDALTDDDLTLRFVPIAEEPANTACWMRRAAAQ